MKLGNHNTLGHHFRDVTYLTVAHFPWPSPQLCHSLVHPCALPCTFPNPHHILDSYVSHTPMHPPWLIWHPLHTVVQPPQSAWQLSHNPMHHPDLSATSCTSLHTTLNGEECNAPCGSRRGGGCKRFWAGCRGCMGMQHKLGRVHEDAQGAKEVPCRLGGIWM